MSFIDNYIYTLLTTKIVSHLDINFILITYVRCYFNKKMNG